MNDLEREIYSLERPEPNREFCQKAKGRLMHKIALEGNEKWFVALLKKILPANPPDQFVRMARVRLLAKIESIRQPVIGWLMFAKRLVASTLVMTIAVMATLFFTDGKQQVIAAEDTYLEVLSGEVMVKHADRLIWNVITKQTELSAGDLLRLGDASSAQIYFFDDSQLRLAENSTLLVSKLGVSPGYARQGVIEASLHKGKAWVQTLNANDGYAQFSLSTPNVIVSASNASFDVQVNLDSTTIRAFKYSVDIRALRQESREVFAHGKLSSFQKVTLQADTSNYRSTDLTTFAPVADLAEEDREEAWVVENLQADRNYLTKLRERELISLRASAGALPGELFYPLKRAKERLGLALRFDEKGQKNIQANIANQRLGEAIILIGEGKTEAAQLALIEYQNLVHQIAKEDKSEKVDRDELSTQIVATHKKTLVAALPGDAQIGIVKQALNQAEELLADNPEERTEIRLQNTVEDLVHIQDFVIAGDLKGAEDALVSHEILASTLLEEAAEQLEDSEQTKELYNQILEAQHEERRILNEIARELPNADGNNQLALLVKTTSYDLENEIKRTAAIARPLLPDVALSQSVGLPENEKVIEFINKINIYKTFQGQKNQINRLLSKYPEYARDLDFLNKVQDRLDTVRTKDIIGMRILKLERELAAAKGRRVQLKIDRAKRARKN